LQRGCCGPLGAPQEPWARRDSWRDTGEGAAGGRRKRPVILPMRPGRPTCTNGDTSLIIHTHDAFPISPAPHLNPTAPCMDIKTDNRLKEMIWVQTTLH